MTTAAEAPTSNTPIGSTEHLKMLEAESIFILRGVVQPAVARPR